MKFQKLLDTFGQHRILGGAAVLAVTQVLASVAGLLRDRLLTSTFPGLSMVDVYISSFRLSDLLFQVTIMSVFSVILVPFLASHHVREDQQEMSRLLSGIMHSAAIGFGLLALFCAIFFRQIAPLFTQFSGESLELYVQFGRIALLSNFLFVFGNAFGQYLITIQRYWIYGLTPMLYTIGTIVGTVFLTPVIGPYGPIVGTLLGSVVYVLVRMAGAMAAGFRIVPVLWHSEITDMGWLMIPRMLALGAVQLELLLFERVASGLDVGSITINAYARNFQSFVVGFVGIALAQSAFPLLSKAAAKKEANRFRIYLRKGIVMILLLTIPASIVLVLLSPVAASLVALSHVLPVFAGSLLLYAFSIPFESLNHLLLRSFYAMKNTMVPALFSVLNGLVAIAAAWILAPHFGVYALAVGFTVGQMVQVIGLSLMLPPKLRTMRLS